MKNLAKPSLASPPSRAGHYSRFLWTKRERERESRGAKKDQVGGCDDEEDGVEGGGGKINNSRINKLKNNPSRLNHNL